MAMPKPNAETFRIRALAHFAKRNLAQARLEIRKGLELQPHWKNLRFTAAMIDYFSALALPAIPGRIVSWPEPVAWALVKRDDESLQRLREAAPAFRELAERSPTEKDERSVLESWCLACLANDPERQDQATAYCAAVLLADPLNYRAIAWATGRRLDVDLSPSETALEALVAQGRADLPHILVLLTQYLVSGKATQALQLLTTTEWQFQREHAEDLWRFSIARARILAGEPETALASANALPDPQKSHLQAMALRALADRTGDWQALIRHLETSYAATGNIEFLLELCELMAQRREWSYVADRACVLVNGIQTEDSLRLGAIVSFNAHRYDLCLKLLDTHRGLCTARRLPAELRRIRVLCQRALGALPSAMAEAESMAREDPSTANLLALVQLQFEAGDLKGVAILARQLSDRADMGASQFLQLAGLVQWEDRALSQSLWRRALGLGLQDESVGTALKLGYQLGLDSELRPLLERMAGLAREGRGGVYAGTVGDLLAMAKRHWESTSKLEEAYRHGIAPIHMIAARANRPLVQLYHHTLTLNETSPHPSRQPFLLIRHGGRALSPLSQYSTQKWRLNLDVTAVLLAAHLEILDAVEKTFAPLRIPAVLIPALISMRDRITPHQPSRVPLYQQIVDLLDSASLRIIDYSELPQPDSLSGVEPHAVARNAFLLHAESTKGYVVDFVASSSQEPNASTINRSRLITCRAVADALRQNGPLSEDDYARALGELGTEGQEHPSQPTVHQNSPLFCLANIPEVLAQGGLLRIACEHFKVFIERREAEAVRASMKAYHSQCDLVDWLRSLTDRLRHGLEKGTYERIPSPATSESAERDTAPDDPGTRCLLTLLQSDLSANDALWIDDRFANSHLHRDAIPIIGINEVLCALVSWGGLNEAGYYRVLGRLRASNARFIPLDKDELLYYLHQAQVRDGALVDTHDLSVMRRYIAACLLSVDTLQRPPMPEGSPNEHGELAFVIGLGRAVLDAIAGSWRKGENFTNSRARADWVIRNIYLDHLALIKMTSIHRPGQDDQYPAALTVAGLLSQAISLDAAKELDGRSVRQDYLEWLDSRILNHRFAADPSLVVTVAEILKKSLLEIKSRDPQDRRGSNRALHAAISVVLQSFYHDLPDVTREELSRDADFMAGIGLKTIRAITVGDLSFEADEFFRAATEAINGREARVRRLGTIARVRFVPSKVASPEAFILFHPLTGQEHEIRNTELPLLRESASEREQFLRRHRSWFDRDETDYERALAEIVSEESPRARIELVESWRKSSASVYYRELHEKVRREGGFQAADLALPEVNSILRHLRVSTPTSGEPQVGELLAAAAESLTRTEDLSTAIIRLASLPVSLPWALVSRVRQLNSTGKRALVRRLIRMAGSPISQLHLVRLLLHAFDELPASQRLARRLVRRLLSADSSIAVEAFLGILGWTADELARAQSSRTLASAIRLIVVWAHAHNLYSILASVGASLDWCKEFFDKRKQQAPAEIFNRDFSWWFDVSHPRELNRLAFLLGGIAYAICGKSETFVDERLKTLFLGTAFATIQGAAGPALPLLRDSTRAPNGLNSFFGSDRGEALSSLIGADEARVFSSASLRLLTDQAIERLCGSEGTFAHWAQLHAVLGGLPPYEELTSSLRSCLARTSFAALLKKDLQCGILAMHLASLQSINLKDESLCEHLKGQLPMMGELLAGESEKLREADSGKTSPDNQEEVKQFFFILLDAALNLSIAVGRENARSVEEFGSLASALMERWRGMMPECRPAFEHLYEDLPISLSKDLLPLLVRLRAE